MREPCQHGALFEKAKIGGCHQAMFPGSGAKVKQMSEIDRHDKFRAWIISQLLDSTAYVRSGRTHQDLPDADLAEQLVDALRQIARDYGSGDWKAASNLFAEYSLRGQSLPADASKALDRVATIIIESVKRLEPLGSKVTEELLKRIEHFASRPKN
jgi:Uri superfamily endonuclease